MSNETKKFQVMGIPMPTDTITPGMVIALMNEVGVIHPISDADGSILTTADDEVLLL